MRDDRTRCRTGQGVESPPSSATDRSSGSTTSAHFTHTAMPVLVARAFVQTRLTRLSRARSTLKNISVLNQTLFLVVRPSNVRAEVSHSDALHRVLALAVANLSLAQRHARPLVAERARDNEQRYALQHGVISEPV